MENKIIKFPISKLLRIYFYNINYKYNMQKSYTITHKHARIYAKLKQSIPAFKSSLDMLQAEINNRILSNRRYLSNLIMIVFNL